MQFAMGMGAVGGTFVTNKSLLHSVPYKWTLVQKMAFCMLRTNWGTCLEHAVVQLMQEATAHGQAAEPASALRAHQRAVTQ